MRKGDRFPALDGLRGIAALMVMFTHLGGVLVMDQSWLAQVLYWPQKFGEFGVDLFFVLSGFLITGILVGKREAPSYFLPFYWHRALRIFPLYFLLLAIVMIALPALGLLTLNDPIWPYFLFVSNLRIFFPVGATDYISVTWTLAMEEQFYFVWSAVVRFFQPRRLAIILIAAWGISILLRNLLVTFYPGDVSDVYVFTAAHLDGLCVGSLIRLAYDRPRLRAPLRRFASAWWCFALAYLIGSWAGLHFEGQAILWRSGFTLRLGITLLSLLFGAMMARGLLEDGAMRHFFDRPFLRRTGAYSYCIYLTHQMLAAATAALWHFLRLPSGEYGSAVLVALEFAVIFAVAAQSRRHFEQPLLGLKALVPYDEPSLVIPAAAIYPADGSKI